MLKSFPNTYINREESQDCTFDSTSTSSMFASISPSTILGAINSIAVPLEEILLPLMMSTQSFLPDCFSFVEFINDSSGFLLFGLGFSNHNT
ncbi:unnamed protein product [Vicia faba]|uniref:Uncharacterized protein n=1 Tax=Vicia faba TaxID=3906 RepID=A0AAV0ZB25_VICFA|nr:unnamed protein product [Vicia faba]